MKLVLGPQCREASCDSHFRTFVEHNFPGANLTEVDASSTEGKVLRERTGIEAPFAWFGPEVSKVAPGFAKIAPVLRTAADGYAMSLTQQQQ